ncbi:hypothetical protein GENT5_15230 [Flavobacterium ammoniigenes]|jgi:Protein of unknown function (DUF2911)|uniref:DUF2911 domain-containing protein n=1 Tax=Flavobacterium ammoniigenes TaxID=1751095 RepID=A0ABM7V6M7_9FLAO|nr:DUF2911 domain-containing protein [Flavobacterium ammoniigenes]BDB55218.1 hypothetical protein GENT5_15230 [Flavobacterium ammoniigenes]
MKKIIVVLAVFMSQFAVQAQIKTPQASPRAIVSQMVGLTEVELNYSRPGAKGRPVFGNLVPFGKLWRTGANENTTISFSDDVIIDGKTLKKGKYALYSVPRIESWDIIFYTATDNWGLPQEFDETKVALRTTVKEEALSKPVESLTINISGLDTSSAYLEIFWENSFVALKFEVPTQKTAMASIEKVLNGPSANDYYSAANFLFQTNTDIAKSLVYVNKSLELSKDKPFWFLRLKSLIQAKQGDKSGAIETAKLSLEAAEEAKNQDYVKMNRDSIAEWSKK